MQFLKRRKMEGGRREGGLQKKAFVMYVVILKRADV